MKTSKSIEFYGEEPKGFIKEVEHSLEKNQNTIEHTLEKNQNTIEHTLEKSQNTIEHTLEKNQNTIEHTLDKTQMSFAKSQKMKEAIKMKRMSFRKASKLIALPILLFFVVSGNGLFDWNKLILKIEKFLRVHSRATLE